MGSAAGAEGAYWVVGGLVEVEATQSNARTWDGKWPVWWQRLALMVSNLESQIGSCSF